MAASRPGSVIVIILLIVVGIVFGLLAIEAGDNPSPRRLAPADVAASTDLGGRMYATIEGVLDDNYVETFDDADGDGVKDEGEQTEAWFYFLVDDRGRGVTVRSSRAPDDIYEYTATGVLVRDPEYVSIDVAQFGSLEGADEFELEDAFYVDATGGAPGAGQTLDLGATLPPAGTTVTVNGPYLGYLDVCSGDADGDGECEESEYDLIDAFIVDPDTGRAITIVQADHPRTSPIVLTGMLRSDPAAIRDAQLTPGMNFESLGLRVSERYLLVDAAGPANALISMGIALAAVILAAILAIGLIGGYLVFRRSTRPLPSGRPVLLPGESIATRVTGSLRQPAGLVHVREASAQLVRFPLEVPETATPNAVAAASGLPEDDVPPAPAMLPVDVTPTPDPVRPDVPTTLIVERVGEPQGVALGKGELRELASGRVMAFRGPRPALRLNASTGRLLLSFDSVEERDRAAAELIGESGLLIRGRGIATGLS